MIDCQRCNNPFAEADVVYLEFDQRTGTHTAQRNIPERHSQGEFPFCKSCGLVEEVLDQEANQKFIGNGE